MKRKVERTLNDAYPCTRDGHLVDLRESVRDESRDMVARLYECVHCGAEQVVHVWWDDFRSPPGHKMADSYPGNAVGSGE